MFSKLKAAVRAAYYLRSTDRLSWRERGVVLKEILSGRAEGPSSEVRLPLRNGSLSLDAYHRPDWHVYRGVFVEETYATDYRDSVVVDVGAHRGIFAAFALQEGCAVLHAYEPEPGNFAFLKKNAENTSSTGQAVHVYQCAVGSRSGRTKFFVYDQSWSHSLLERVDRKIVSELEVLQIDFESVISRAVSVADGRRRIIVKIDAEGAEYDILQNTPPRVTAMIDELFVEIHSYGAGEPAYLVTLLAESGLVCPSAQHAIDKHQLVHFINRK